jgi:23S rRNA pseudouridine1911/1915/1917 synthase
VDKQVHFLFSGSQPERLDKFIARSLPQHTRSKIQALIRAGNVRVDDEVILKTGYSVEEGAHVVVLIPPMQPSTLMPENIPLQIVFENDSVIVVNKPAGMVVHPSAGHSSSTLVHALLAHLPHLAEQGDDQRPGIVHRLDKDTSGLILVAKSEASQLWLQQQFSSRKVEKTYLALVDGHPRTQRGRIEAPIYRHPNDRKKMAIAPTLKGREAATLFSVEKEYTNHTLLKVKPLTGRTHQIRVHLTSIGLPIVGDTLYGRKNPSLPLNRQFLHAFEIKIILFSEKEPRIFHADLPKDLENVLNDLPNKGS